MIPQTAYYSHRITDPDGNIHEIGLSGLIEEGEDYGSASEKVAEMVLQQSEKFIENFNVNFDEELAAAEAEVNSVEAEINDRLESLGSFTQFAEVLGMDMKVPTYPFSIPQPEVTPNESTNEGTAATENPAA